MSSIPEQTVRDIKLVLEAHLDACSTKNVTLLRKSFAEDALFVGTDDTEQWSIDELAKFLEESEHGWNMVSTGRLFYDPALGPGHAVGFFETLMHKRYGPMRGFRYRY